MQPGIEVMDILDRLIGHDRWTTERLLRRCGDLTVADWDREFDIGHQTLRRTFEHFLLARRSWVDLMTRSPGIWMAGDPLPDNPFEEFLERNQASSERLEKVAKDVIAAGRLDDLFADAHGYRQSYGATIVQVILHAHGHRTEILHMLSRLGIEPLPEGDPLEWEWALREQG